MHILVSERQEKGIGTTEYRSGGLRILVLCISYDMSFVNIKFHHPLMMESSLHLMLFI